jgi:hypothetical protein
MQRIIDKDLDLPQALRMLACAEKHEISMTVSLIMGYPEETLEDLRQTDRFFTSSLRLSRAAPTLSYLAPLVGTPLYNKHKHELEIDEFCSEMSNQARRRDPVDQLLVLSHSEIFPNFYLIPTPHMDRSWLREFREFANTVGAHVRWLVVALVDAGYDLMDLFDQFRPVRAIMYPAMRPAEFHEYYRSSRSRHDFVQFVRSRSWPDGEAIRAMCDLEAAMENSALRTTLECDTVCLDGELDWDDVPVLASPAHVFRLKWDLRAVIERLASGNCARDLAKDSFYVTEAVSRDATKPREVPERVAYALELCDGTRTVSQITRAFAEVFPQWDGLTGEEACWVVLEIYAEKGMLRRLSRSASSEFIHGAPIPNSAYDFASATAS